MLQPASHDGGYDTHRRYIEAEVDGLAVSCLYLPNNGNPAPGLTYNLLVRSAPQPQVSSRRSNVVLRAVRFRHPEHHLRIAVNHEGHWA